MLRISYREEKTNEFVRNLVGSLVGTQEPLLKVVKRRKLKWFGHIIRHGRIPKVAM